MPKPKDLPIEAEDPRYTKILLRGARETFEIDCGTPQRAHHFQARLCKFRKDLKNAFPDDESKWRPLYQCVVGKKAKDSAILRLYPRHEEFEDILSQVDDIEPDHLDHDPLEDL